MTISSQDDEIVGKCILMCPESETYLREKEGLLHRLEATTSSQTNRVKKADPSKTIKCFSRSAAGVIKPQLNLLRPAPILEQTVQYLMTNVAPHYADRPLDVYDFITDRLRAVRQDITIQRMNPKACAPILEPMVRFHALFGYFLSTHSQFDRHLNKIHLHECLTTLINCYNVTKNDKLEIYSMFMCLNINLAELVVHKLQSKNISFELLMAWNLRNAFKVFYIINKLDICSLATLHEHIFSFREYVIRAFCTAMSSANARYPIDNLALLLSYNSTADCANDCERLGIKISNGFALFNKKDLLHSNETSLTKWWLLEQKLSETTIERILLKGY